MKNILALAVFLFGASFTHAVISVDVYKADGITPLEIVDPGQPHTYIDIMVDTRLVIYVSSDTNDVVEGFDLAALDDNIGIGQLYGRGPIDVADYTGSHYPAAGVEAGVMKWEESGIDGFNLDKGSSEVVPGRWFVIDYNSIELGPCDIAFFDRNVSWDEPVYYLEFNHVRTRDFYADYQVDFKDYAVLASKWRYGNCASPGWCTGADLDTDGDVDIADLQLFSDFWLEKTR